jgi:hypothetical protein
LSQGWPGHAEHEYSNEHDFYCYSHGRLRPFAIE